MAFDIFTFVQMFYLPLLSRQQRSKISEIGTEILFFLSSMKAGKHLVALLLSYENLK